MAGGNAVAGDTSAIRLGVVIDSTGDGDDRIGSGVSTDAIGDGDGTSDNDGISAGVIGGGDGGCHGHESTRIVGAGDGVAAGVFPMTTEASRVGLSGAESGEVSDGVMIGRAMRPVADAASASSGADVSATTVSLESGTEDSGVGAGLVTLLAVGVGAPVARVGTFRSGVASVWTSWVTASTLASAPYGRLLSTSLHPDISARHTIS